MELCAVVAWDVNKVNDDDDVDAAAAVRVLLKEANTTYV